MARNNDWQVDDVRADALVRPYPALQIGASASYRFVFDERGDAGNDLVNERDYIERYAAVRERLEHAGQYVVKRQMDGAVRWHEQTPHGADPLLVRLEPVDDPADMTDPDEPAEGVWGLIEDGSHQSPVGGAPGFVTLDVLVVARADDYDTRRALEAERRFGN